MIDKFVGIKLLPFIHRHYGFSLITFAVLSGLTAFIPIPIWIFVILLGGYLFSFIPAAVFYTVGIIIGSTTSFLRARYLFAHATKQRYRKPLKSFIQAAEKRKMGHILKIRLFDEVPSYLVNILAGLSRVSLWNFIWTTAVITFPFALIFAYAGQQFIGIN